MPLRENELARREIHGLVLRPTPLRVKWEFADLASSDGHNLSFTFACSLRPVADPIERKMLEEVLLNGRARLTSEEVSAHFEPQLRAAAARIGQAHAADAWIVQDALRSELIEVMKTSANAVAFVSELAVLAPL